MASAPSASALLAVLRCRGKLLSHKQGNKRPRGSVYRLGLACGTGFETGQSNSRQDTPDESGTNRLLFQDARLGVLVRLEPFSFRGHHQIKPVCDYSHHSCKDLRTYKPSKEWKSHHVLMPGRWIPNLNVDTLGSVRHYRLLRTLRGYEEDTVSGKVSSESPMVLCVCFGCKRNHVDTVGQNSTQSLISHGMSIMKNTMLSFTTVLSDLLLAKLGIVLKSSTNSGELNEDPKSEDGKKDKVKKSWRNDAKA